MGDEFFIFGFGFGFGLLFSFIIIAIFPTDLITGKKFATQLCEVQGLELDSYKMGKYDSSASNPYLKYPFKEIICKKKQLAKVVDDLVYVIK